jgi:hypothetical protein
MLQWYREIDYWSHPNDAQHAKRLVLVKKIVVGLGMSYEKIDVCGKNSVLLRKEHKDDTNVCILIGLDM